MELKGFIGDPLMIKRRRERFDERLKEDERFKLAQYQAQGTAEPLRIAADERIKEDPKFASVLENLESRAQELLSSAEHCQSILSSALSPELLSKAQEGLLKGSILTREGRLIKLETLKDLGVGLTSPLFLLHLGTLILDAQGSEDAILGELKGIHAQTSKLLAEQSLEREAKLEDAADRLFFYAGFNGSLSAEDRKALLKIDEELSLEILKSAKRLQSLRCPKPKRHLRDLSEARAAAALLEDDFFAVIEHSIQCSFLALLAMLLVRRETDLSYERTWSLDEKILRPVSELLAFVHAQILCRLKLLEDTVKLNPLDKSKLRRLSEDLSLRFYAVEKRFLSLLAFYRQKVVITVSLQAASETSK